ncbi:MAG TPA: M20/M25/M40 family metallo-hydrolase [Vicinamibacterales bacterium]|nr:M20/M25/M40 family metallo-hydrolase [Vicinamibacterales bacterium]
MRRLAFLFLIFAATTLTAQTPQQPDWSRLEEETMRHFQALLRFDTSDPPSTPPGGEKPAADYIKDVLEKEGIPVQVFALEANRPNIVARLKGNGSKRPLLLMAHTDVVNVDPKKWSHPPFSATREGGYVYSRGTVDDKDNVAAVLMVMLTLKRQNVPLDRDVIALFEAGEEGTTRVGIQFMVNQHLASIESEFCFAEGGGVTRQAGQVKFATVQTLEKIPHAITLTARGVAGHGSVPLETNSVVHLSDAVAKVGKWAPPIRPNETTAAYFKRLATISSPEEAERYRNALSPDPKVSGAADEYFRKNEPRHASMLRTSVSPNMFSGGYRVNVIPSEATATLDVRMLPDEDPKAFLEQVKRIVADPTVEVAFAARDTRPGGTSRLNTEAFAVLEANITKHYKTLTLPTMSTGATDMAYLRSKGIQCYGVGPATDIEDGPKGFGAHSDQERILESELHRFVRFHYDIVADLVRRK